ncbi:oxidoreductase C-terminal domain-containing protein, partial [Rubrivirga sp.]|uniref:oxidoreductase C-terminal domain-containing protein n=1 Tax=Rubrivirga sp. TaxID=1885344 RepID=UPI003C78E3B6
GVSLRDVGHVEDWDEVVIDGSLEDRSFVASYLEGDVVRAVAAVGRDKDAAAFNALLARGDTVLADSVRDGADFQARL